MAAQDPMLVMNQINDHRRQMEAQAVMKRRLRDFAQGVERCSGDDRDALRTWLSHIDDVRQWAINRLI